MLETDVNSVATLFTYDGRQPIREWTGSGAALAWNIYGAGPDEILWRYENGVGHLRYHLDRQGSVAFILDLSGNGLERYTYDAFGQPTITDWNGANPRTTSNYGNRFMFTGREWLAPLGIYDYRNRMYQPQLGRFLQPDPIGFAAGDANLFRYCGGDPVNRTDPSGLLASSGTRYLPPPKIQKRDGSQVPWAVGGLTSQGGGYWSGGGGLQNGDRANLGVDGRNGFGQFLTPVVIGFTRADGGYNADGSPVLIAPQLFTITSTDLVRGFYGNFGDRLDAAIKTVFGADAGKIPAQTTSNAPIVILSFTPSQLGQFAQQPGAIWGWNDRTFANGTPNGTIYVASGLSRVESFRTYAHELGNLLDARLNGGYETTYGRQDIGHNDTGGALEVELFGVPPGGF